MLGRELFDKAVAVWGAGGAVLLLSCGSTSAELPVEFSQMRVEEVTATRAVVRFDTSVDTSCELEFGLTADGLDRIATDPDMDPNNPYSYDHQVPLEDLDAAQTYYFRARVTTRAGRTFRSTIDSFRTSDGAGAQSLNASVLVETTDLTNVASLSSGSRMVEVSSNFGGAQNDETWGVNAALDGLMATEWSSNGDGDDAFLTVELNEATELVAFGYRSRKMTDGSSIVRSVRLILDGDRELGPFSTPNPDQYYVFPLDPGTAAERIRLEAVETTGGNTGAKEVQLYARP